VHAQIQMREFAGDRTPFRECCVLNAALLLVNEASWYS
jgi:hypothetical protein